MKEQIIKSYADYCRAEINRAEHALQVKMGGKPLFDKKEVYGNAIQRMIGAGDLAQMMASNASIFEAIEAQYNYYKNMLEDLIESF